MKEELKKKPNRSGNKLIPVRCKKEGFIAWMNKAEEYKRKGIKQIKCVCCSLWLWPDERKGHKFKKRKKGGTTGYGR